MARGGWFRKRPNGMRAMESVPEGIATKCAKCNEIIFVRDLERNLKVCSKCGHHHRLSAQERIAITVDPETFEEMDWQLVSLDPLHFPEYAAKQQRARDASGVSEAVVTGTGAIDGHKVVLCIADFAFMGGSMGSVVGEKIARAVDLAMQLRLPFVAFTASGGARMQEGLIALMQMAKTSAAVARLASAGLPYITVLTDPTTGGVYASYASIGDVILAEPGAIVGFAGRRVANQDLGVKLPDNFQTSEFQLEYGMVDRIVQRKEMRSALSYLLSFFTEEAARA